MVGHFPGDHGVYQCGDHIFGFGTGLSPAAILAGVCDQQPGFVIQQEPHNLSWQNYPDDANPVIPVIPVMTGQPNATVLPVVDPNKIEIDTTLLLLGVGIAALILIM